MAMSYAGKEMAVWQGEQVSHQPSLLRTILQIILWLSQVWALRQNRITADQYLSQVADIFKQLFAAVHFMGETCRVCHHDVKMFNVPAPLLFSAPFVTSLSDRSLVRLPLKSVQMAR